MEDLSELLHCVYSGLEHVTKETMSKLMVLDHGLVVNGGKSPRHGGQEL